MLKSKYQNMIEQIAKKEHISPEAVYSQMQEALFELYAHPDPISQAIIDSIPRKSNQLTVEDFLDYMTQK